MMLNERFAKFPKALLAARDENQSFDAWSQKLRNFSADSR